jgi:hypothetical protein
MLILIIDRHLSLRGMAFSRAHRLGHPFQQSHSIREMSAATLTDADWDLMKHYCIDFREAWSNIHEMCWTNLVPCTSISWIQSLSPLADGRRQVSSAVRQKGRRWPTLHSPHGSPIGHASLSLLRSSVWLTVDPWRKNGLHTWFPMKRNGVAWIYSEAGFHDNETVPIKKGPDNIPESLPTPASVMAIEFSVHGITLYSR